MKNDMPVIKQSYFGLGFTSAPAARENQYNACFSKKKRKKNFDSKNLLCS